MDRTAAHDRHAAKRATTRKLWRSTAAWLSLMVVSAVVLAACTGGGSADPILHSMATEAAGRPVTDFELMVLGNGEYVRGDLVRLSQFRGQPMVVNFWFPSCPPCRAEMPDLERSFQSHKSDGVAFIGVQLLGLDSAEDGQAFIDEIGISYPVGPDEDSDVTRDDDYEVTSFPTTFFLDRDHTVIRKHGGILTPEQMEESIQELLQLGQAEGV